MRWSIPLGRVFGIRIGIHVTFFLVVAWAAWLGWRYDGVPAAYWAVGMIALLFVCVILHELGHSVVAMRFGIEVAHITLLPIGGVAAMKSMPEEPRQELLIAIAGPLVNVAILLALVPWWGFPSWIDAPVIPQSPAELLDAVIRANMILIVFNLIPAFPMDGGRVLRATLATFLSYPRATAWAAGVGRVMAVLFIFGGLSVSPFLALIGVFVFLGASGENRMVHVKDAVKNVPVSLLLRPAPRLEPDATVRDCLEAYHRQGQEHFVWFDEAGVRGLVPSKIWMDALKEKGPDTPVAEIAVRRFISFRPETPLDAIIQDVWGLNQECIPVIASGRVEGVLLLEDIRQFIRRRLGETPPPAPNPTSSSAPAPATRGYSIDLG